jgi:hypothetical protein
MHVGGRDEESYDGGTVVSRGEPNLCWDGFDAGCQAPYIGSSPRSDLHAKDSRSVQILIAIG